jgi:hypothetical protein
VLDDAVRGHDSVRTTSPQDHPPESPAASSAGEIPQQITSALQASEDAS